MINLNVITDAKNGEAKLLVVLHALVLPRIGEWLEYGEDVFKVNAISHEFYADGKIRSYTAVVETIYKKAI